MKVYIVLTEDPHFDTDVEVWLDKQQAIDRGWEVAHKLDRHGNVKEQPIEGWLLHLCYNVESYVTVQEKPLKVRFNNGGESQSEEEA